MLHLTIFWSTSYGAEMFRYFKSKPHHSLQQHSLGFLNISQFLGVVNDNLFKLVLVFMLIDAQGPSRANMILSLAGAIFVIPFLLFSSSAGMLADRCSKQRILRYIKAVEIVIMVLAFIAFAYQSAWAGYALLFLLAAQSAVFGPAKYGIIPELVPTSAISKSNGLITSFTYLGIIIGTFFASFMTEITNHNFWIVIAFALALAVIGFVASFGVKYTPPQGSKKKFNIWFIRTIFKTLHSVRDERHLLLAVSGSAYFLFIGAFTQLNIIPFAMQSLKLSEVAGGYLFLSTAFGIAAGSYLAGKASRKRVEMAMPCIAGLAIALFLFCLSIFSTNLTLTIIFLFVLGVAGGGFIVPCDSFAQVFSPQEKRGQVIAASNFLGFVGVLVASFAIFLFGDLLELRSATSFFLIGLTTLIFSLFLIFRVSDYLFHFLSRKLLVSRRLTEKPDLSLLYDHPHAPLVLPKGSFRETMILVGVIPHLHVYFLKKSALSFPWFGNLFYSLHRSSSDEKLPQLIEKQKGLIRKDEHLCIVGDKLLHEPHPHHHNFFKTFFAIGAADVLHVHFKWDHQKKKASLHFTKESLG